MTLGKDGRLLLTQSARNEALGMIETARIAAASEGTTYDGLPETPSYSQTRRALRWRLSSFSAQMPPVEHDFSTPGAPRCEAARRAFQRSSGRHRQLSW